MCNTRLVMSRRALAFDSTFCSHYASLYSFLLHYTINHVLPLTYSFYVVYSTIKLNITFLNQKNRNLTFLHLSN